jgi:threonine/homoserine/homoserine lactone efflux protein
MSQALIGAFVLFAVVALFTPGPNNIMLLSSGLTFGFRRTLPLIAGIAIGFALMVALVGLGLGAVFTAFPWLQVVLKYSGAAYLAYLAVAIARADPVAAGEAAQSRPMTFLGAALFQWVNAKGWVIAVGTITAYAAIAPFPWNIVTQTTLILLIGAMSATTWALFGSALRPWLSSPRKVRAFNLVMALLLLASLYPALAES